MSRLIDVSACHIWQTVETIYCLSYRHCVSPPSESKQITYLVYKMSDPELQCWLADAVESESAAP